MNKVKEQNQLNVIRLNYKENTYLVIMEYLKNTTCGAPRYKAIIIPLEDEEIDPNNGVISLFNYVYTFTGSYCSLYDEAMEILKHALNEE